MALAGLIENRRQPEGWPNSLRVPEARWNVDRADKGQGYDRTHARDGMVALGGFWCADILARIIPRRPDCVADEAVSGEPVSEARFPANREFNREFFKFVPFSAILAPNQRANSNSCSKIP